MKVAELDRQESMDEIVIVPADPPQILSTDADDAPRPVEMQMRDGQVPTDVNAPPTSMQMQREAGTQISTHKAFPLTLVVKMLNILNDILDELCHLQNYKDCLETCCFIFFCHGIINLIFSICCRCCTSLLKIPDRIAKRTARTHKIVAFLAKHLSTLWVSSLLVLFARWVLFRPLDVKPHLATSTIHQFELTSMGALRFNVTTAVPFHNGHSFYKIHYHHFAASFLYADVNLGPADDHELPTFRQKPHESTLECMLFAGRLRNASGTVEETFARETVEGLLHMLVRIRVLLRYGFWPFKGDYFTVYDCPLISPSTQLGEPALSSPARRKNLHV